MPIVERLFRRLPRLHRGRSRGDARRRVLAAIGHALAFTTWRLLVRDQGLDDTRATDLMCRLVAAASGRPDNR